MPACDCCVAACCCCCAAAAFWRRLWPRAAAAPTAAPVPASSATISPTTAPRAAPRTPAPGVVPVAVVGGWRRDRRRRRIGRVVLALLHGPGVARAFVLLLLIGRLPLGRVDVGLRRGAGGNTARAMSSAEARCIGVMMRMPFSCGTGRRLLNLRSPPAMRQKPVSRRLKSSINGSRSVAHFTNVISPGFQVLSNHGSRGPYARKSVNQPLPGLVSVQLASLPLGAVPGGRSRGRWSRRRWRPSCRAGCSCWGKAGLSAAPSGSAGHRRRPTRSSPRAHSQEC